MNDAQPASESLSCARCGRTVDADDHYEVIGAGNALLCRLEHVVAWVMRGARWQGDGQAGVSEPLVLVRHRAGEKIHEDFDSPEALRTWASAGGHWAKSTDR